AAVTGGTWTRPATTASPDGDRAARGPDPRRAGEPRDVAVERRPVHAPAVPHLVELGRAVLGAAVVPEDGVAHTPAMPVDEVVARRPFLEMADQILALGRGEPLDLAGPPADVERGPARARVLTRDRMPHVGALGLLLVGERRHVRVVDVVEADPAEARPPALDHPADVVGQGGEGGVGV